MPLLNVGSAYRSITGSPIRFALRVYVPQQDLDAAYAPGIPRAMDPFTAGVHEFSEQLARLTDTSQPLLPPAGDPLWAMPFSTAPAGSRRLADAAGSGSAGASAASGGPASGGSADASSWRGETAAGGFAADGSPGGGAAGGESQTGGVPGGRLPGGAVGRVPGASPDVAGDFPVFHPTQRLRRSLRLFTAAENEDSAQLLPLLVPENQVDGAAQATSREAFQPVYTRESSYVVPLAWFAAFTPEDRVTSQHSGHEVHRLIAPADVAAARVKQAAKTVEDAARSVTGDTTDPGDLPEEAQQATAFAEDLTRLARWLDAFSPASLVSLDYGSVADRLQPDESPQDMADAVELLREGDFGSATAALRRIFVRWAPLAHLQQAN